MSWGWYEETEVWSTGWRGYIGDMNMTRVNGTMSGRIRYTVIT